MQDAALSAQQIGANGSAVGWSAGGWTGAARGVAVGAAGAVSSQAINQALGQNTAFSWNAIAASSVTGALGGYLGNDDPLHKIPGDAAGITNGTLNGIAYGSLNRAIVVALDGHGKIDFANIAADSFGNALGNSIVGALQSSAAERKMQQQADKRKAEQIAGRLSGGGEFSLTDSGGFNLGTVDAPEGLFANVLDGDSASGLVAANGYNGDPVILSDADQPSGAFIMQDRRGDPLSAEGQAMLEFMANALGIGGSITTPMHENIMQMSGQFAPSAEVQDWSTLDAGLYAIGQKDIFSFKDQWVEGYSGAILGAAEKFDLPPELVAGVVFNEVGGDPLWIDDVAYDVRSGMQSIFSSGKQPELTSFGNVSM